MVSKESALPKAQSQAKPKKVRVNKKAKSTTTALSSRLYTAELFDVAKLLLERARNRVCDMPITEICTIQGLYNNSALSHQALANEPAGPQIKKEPLKDIPSSSTSSSLRAFLKELEFCQLTMALLSAESASFHYQLLK